MHRRRPRLARRGVGARLRLAAHRRRVPRPLRLERRPRAPMRLRACGLPPRQRHDRRLPASAARAADATDACRCVLRRYGAVVGDRPGRAELRCSVQHRGPIVRGGPARRCGDGDVRGEPRAVLRAYVRGSGPLFVVRSRFGPRRCLLVQPEPGRLLLCGIQPRRRQILPVRTALAAAVATVAAAVTPTAVAASGRPSPRRLRCGGGARGAPEAGARHQRVAPLVPDISHLHGDRRRRYRQHAGGVCAAATTRWRRLPQHRGPGLEQ